MSPKARKALKELGIPIRKPRVEKGKEKSNYEPPHIEELPESRTRTASPAPQPTNNQAGGPRQSAKKLSHRVENTGTGSASAQVCLAISPDHQLLTRGPEKAPFPRQGSQICSYCTFTACASQNSFPDSYPVCLSSCKMPTSRDIFLRLTSGCLTLFSAVCLGLRTL
jgi:hypothetical protein